MDFIRWTKHTLAIYDISNLLQRQGVALDCQRRVYGTNAVVPAQPWIGLHMLPCCNRAHLLADLGNQARRGIRYRVRWSVRIVLRSHSPVLYHGHHPR